jgi:hypothetical protein
MVDVDPTATVAKYSPRESTLVDAVAEATRVADQNMRSNPMKNARIDSGLTVWTGNYGGDLVWIGEFLPPDRNMFDQYGNVRPQRGLSIVRDDTQRNSAIALYDFDPRAGVPLRQRLYMQDADGFGLMREGYNGGRAFPDHPIPMYARLNIEAGLSNGTDDVIWQGAGNIVGTVLEFHGSIPSSGTVTITYFIRVIGINGVTVNSPTRVAAGPVAFAETIDIAALHPDADFATVEFHAFRSAGTGLYFARPVRCRTFSNLTA